MKIGKVFMTTMVCIESICGCCAWWGYMSAHESCTIKECQHDGSIFFNRERPANAYACGKFKVSKDYLEWKIKDVNNV